MISIKNILCPTDFSSHADHALGYGVEFARQFGAKLHLHHVVHVPYVTVAYEIGPDLAAAQDAAEKEGKAVLEAKAAELEAPGIEIATHLTIGTPFVDIVALARRCEIDLIILATHGRGAIKQILVGSTAERVVRKAPCPVLTIKHPEHEFVLP